MYGDAPDPSGRAFADSGWVRPSRIEQHTLFGTDTERSLAAAGVSADDANHWFELGWLSFMPAFIDAIDEPVWHELLFIRDVAASGMSEDAVTALLKQLPRPCVYDPYRVAFSFRFGWVQLPTRPQTTPDPSRWTPEVVREWIALSVKRGDAASLRATFEFLCHGLDQVSPDA